MRGAVGALALGAWVWGLGVASAAPRQELTLERVVQRPAPGMAVPRRVSFAPDGKAVTFLQAEEGSLVQSLWSLDLSTGVRFKLLGEGGVGVIWTQEVRGFRRFPVGALRVGVC